MKTKVIVATLLALLIFAGCAAPQQLPRHQNLRDDLMDTIMIITAYGNDADDAIRYAFRRMEEIHTIANVNDPESIVSRMAELAGSGEFVSDELIYTLLEISEFAYSMSDGAFNPALGPLIQLWAIGSENERIPERHEIDTALSLIVLEDVLWDESGVSLARQGMSLDFGGVAKGYAGKEAARVLREHGVEHALIDLGGDLYALGTRPDGNPWRIGLRSPLGDGTVIGVLELADTSVMTSGSYIRYFEWHDERFHHIFDPRTGLPADSGLISVSVIYEDAALADAISTALFVSGLQGSDEILSIIPGMSAIFITNELEVYLVGEQAQSLRLNDDRFRIVLPHNN